jgi:hypothetical protein
VGLTFGTGVVLLGRQPDIPAKPGVSGANVSRILIAHRQGDVLQPELLVGSIAAKAAINQTLNGTPAHLHQSFALNADADSPYLTMPTVSARRSPVTRPRKAQSN